MSRMRVSEIKHGRIAAKRGLPELSQGRAAQMLFKHFKKEFDFLSPKVLKAASSRIAKEFVGDFRK